MFDTIKIGKRIAELRKKKNITQMELADAMGISFQAVSNWERGNSMPDISKLPELSELFGVSIDEILCGKSKAVEAATEGNLVEMIGKNEISRDELAEVTPLIKPEDAKNNALEIARLAISKGEIVEDFLPYIDENGAFELAKIAIERDDGVTCFLPYMDEDDVFELAKIAIKKGDGITCFLSYMDEDDVFELAKIAIERDDGVTCFLPYMDEDDVFELAKIMYNRGEAIKELLPYMDDDYASSFVKEML